MAMRLLRAIYGKEWRTIREGIADPEHRDDPARFVCPGCNSLRTKKKPQADCIQYGFEWDDHVTVFKCKCGCMFYAKYRLWHTEMEVNG